MKPSIAPELSFVSYASLPLIFSIALLPNGTAFAASTSTAVTYDVLITTHLCGSSIKNWGDFEAMESGKSPMAAMTDDALACRTTVPLAGSPSSGSPGSIAALRSSYDFTLESDLQTETLLGNGMIVPSEICASALDISANSATSTSSSSISSSDRSTTSSNCIDISGYEIPIRAASSTILTISETQPPAGYHFGVLRFTATTTDQSDDSQDLSYIDPQTGRIDLNMAPDSDGIVALDIYQFQNNPTATTSTTPSSNGSNTKVQDLSLEFQMLTQKFQEILSGILASRNNASSSISAASSTTPVSTMNTTTTTPIIPTTAGATTGMIFPIAPTEKVGTSIDFAGSGFGPRETVNVMLGGAIVATAHADSNGNFTTGAIAVSNDLGTYLYTFQGQQSGTTGSDTVTVTSE